MVSSARIPSLPYSPEPEPFRAVPTEGPPTVRVAVFSAPGPHAELHTTPAPLGDRKLSGPFLTALAQEQPDAPTVGVNRFPVPGDLFLGFRLVEELGRGSFARVFLARQEALAGRPVALKVTLRPTREAERLARLQHTNVVPVYSVHDAAPAQVICMPYLGRRTIADLIRAYRAHNSTRGLGGRRTTRAVRPSRTTALADASKSAAKSHPADPTNPPAPPAVVVADPSLIGDPLAVVRLLERLSDGLAHAHDRGILHLDLKPANVLLADDDEPMLLDFNLSFDAADRERGLVGGTIPYMAIEQLIDLKSRGKGKIDCRTDLYSLGVMAYEMLTGTVPFPASGPTDVDALVADRRQGCPPIRALNPLVTPAVEAIVKKLLAPEPKDRYQNAAALRADLRRHLGDLPLETAREPSVRERFRKWRRRNPGVPARLLAASVVGLLIGLAGASYMRAEGNARAAATERVRATRSGLDRLRIDLILPGDPATRARAVAKAEEILANYGVPNDANWAARGDAGRLAEADRAALRGDLGELAFLVAQAKWRDAEYRPIPARLDGATDALKFNRAALACFDTAEVPAVLHEQAAVLAAAAAEPPLDPPPARAVSRKTPVRELFLEASAAVTTAHYAAALPILERVTAEQPGHAAAQFCLAYCRQQKGEYARALERYDVARVLMPDDPLPAYQRGVCYTTVRRPKEAEAEFSRAIELDSGTTRAYRDRALARYRLGGREKWKEAEADLTEALGRGSPAMQIHLLRAEVRKKLGDAAGEAADRKAADEFVPQSEMDYIVRGWASMKRRDAEAALADYDEALSLNPRSLTALQNQAHVLADLMKDLPAALEVATRAAEMYPEYAPSRAGRALILARLGKRDEAIREGDRALLLSDDPEVVYQVACVYAHASRTHAEDGKRALDLLRQAFKAGFADVAMMRGDRDLDDLRLRPEFTNLERALTNLFGQ